MQLLWSCPFRRLRQYSEPQEKANIINSFFASVFTQEDTSPPLIGKSDPIPDMPPIQIHQKGFIPTKTTGPDEIPSHLLKELTHHIASTLAFLALSILQGRLNSLRVVGAQLTG